MRKRWLKFLRWCIRQECIERIRDDGRQIGEILDRYREARALYLRHDRRDEPDTIYWKGYVEAIEWVLRVK